MALRHPTTRAPLNLRGKILLAFTLLTALLTLLVGSLYVVTVTRADRAHITDKLHLTADHLSELIRLPLYAEDRTRLTEISSGVVTQPEMRSISISAADGRTLIELHSSELNSSDPGIAASTTIMSGSSSSSAEEAIAGGTVPRYQIGTLTLVRNTADLDRQLIQLTQKTILTSLLIWTLVTAVFWLILRRHTSSYSELMRGIGRLQQHDYTTTITTLSDNEAGAAAVALNDLGLRLQEKMRENERLTSDLRDRNLRITTLLNLMPAGVCRIDASGTIDFLNAFFTQLFGYTPKDTPTCTALMAALFRDVKLREQVISRLEAEPYDSGGTEQRFTLTEAETVCKDGTTRRVIIKRAIEQNGGVILIMIDVTELELLRTKAIKNQQLESIGILAGGVAHNFNNALTGVMGYISMAIKRLDNNNDPLGTALNKAQKASMRAAEMAQQLLTFARGGAPIKLPISLKHLITEAASAAIQGSPVHLSIEIPDHLPPILADENQMHQVFSNLSINAVQAMPAGGFLTISAEYMPTESHCDGKPAIAVQFIDNGRGIPHDDLERIFEPYFTTKNCVSNSGLGLASARSIVHRHGGRITARSVVGSGSTFTLLLPAVPKSSAAATGATITFETTPTCLSRKVLVMDDDDVIRDFASECLTQLDYHPVVCENGDAAVQLFREAFDSGYPYLAAILDLTVTGGMGGADAASCIREFAPHARLIVSSGHSHDLVLSEYKQHGFSALLLKPYKIDDLKQVLLDILPT